VGNFVLNFQIQPHTTTPQVVSIRRDDGIEPGGSPARFYVQFNEAINVQQLAYLAYQVNPIISSPPQVFVQGPGNSIFYPWLQSYDPATNTATFVMADGLPSGVYQLHLSGPNGLADWAGNPLAGNGDPSGDFVYTFTVNDPNRPAGQPDPLVRFDQNPKANPQNVGILFTNEIQNGFTITRNFTSNPPADTGDVYEFQVLERQDYVFSLSGTGLPAGTYAVLVDASTGQQFLPDFQGNTSTVKYTLDPGVYLIEIGGWTAGNASQVTYNLVITMLNNPERPTALPVGASPAISLRLVSTLPPPPQPAPPSPPAGSSNQGGLPNSVLVALTSGLLGGNSGADPGDGGSALPGVNVLDRVVAQAPRLPGASDLLQLASLYQTLAVTTGEDEVESSTPPLVSADEGGTVTPTPPWGQVIESLFRWWDPGEQPPQKATSNEFLPENIGIEPLDRWFSLPSPWMAAKDPDPAVLEGFTGIEKEMMEARASTSPSGIAALALAGMVAGSYFERPKFKVQKALGIRH
jgi:hypothetical protein